jgi:ribosome assembly protein YihI (activator of Der GTPase)
MQIKYLSDSIKIKCKQEFNKLNNNRLQDMLSALEFDNSKPIELQKYFAQLDRIRNTDHKRIFTWIYE